MFVGNVKIKKVKEYDNDIFGLVVDKTAIGEEIKCGQFFNLLPDAVDGMILRRPISVGWQDDKKLTFYIKKLGKGTNWMANLSEGDEINIMGPLGRGFDPGLSEGKNALLIGGGVGVAPLIELGKAVKANKASSIHYLIGFNDMPYGRSHIERITDKIRIHSANNKKYLSGYPTDGLAEYIEENKIDIIYTCGPDLMMKNIVEVAGKSEREVKVQVSLEERMGCGFGVCLCCSKIVDDKESTAPDAKKTVCVCKEGPIFDGNEVY